MTGEVLSDRAVNRATLARQLLLRRWPLGVEEAIARTVGLNAQTPNAAYYWLWARLSGFRRDHLTAAIEDRAVVRSTLLRSTQHIVVAGDFPWLREVLRPLLVRVQRNTWGARTAGVDMPTTPSHARCGLGVDRRQNLAATSAPLRTARHRRLVELAHIAPPRLLPSVARPVALTARPFGPTPSGPWVVR